MPPGWAKDTSSAVIETSKVEALLSVYDTYHIVNGFENNANERIIVSAFRQVVTVTATNAPVVRTKCSTNRIPT